MINTTLMIELTNSLLRIGDNIDMKLNIASDGILTCDLMREEGLIHRDFHINLSVDVESHNMIIANGTIMYSLPDVEPSGITMKKFSIPIVKSDGKSLNRGIREVIKEERNLMTISKKAVVEDRLLLDSIFLEIRLLGKKGNKENLTINRNNGETSIRKERSKIASSW